MKTFSLLENFPELAIGIFGKEDAEKSDEECALQLGFGKLCKLNQVHGTRIHIAEAMDTHDDRNFGGGNENEFVSRRMNSPANPPFSVQEGDGLITMERGRALSIRFADCQAFVIYVPEKTVLGVLHAGWRGMASHIITTFFETLDNYFSAKSEDTFIGAVPSLCRKCANFTDPLRELPPHLHPFIEGSHVDLQAAAEAEFDALGVPKNHRERKPGCTKCGEGYWSWREDRDPDAKNYLVAGLRGKNKRCCMI